MASAAHPCRSRPGRTRTTPDDSPAAKLLRAGLPLVALATLAVVVAFSLWSAAAAGTLGYDFLAYHQAANRLLVGTPLYDPTVVVTGGFGLFYYPPPFAVALLPLAPVDPTAASWIWAGLSIAAFLGGVVLLPVRPSVRWAIMLLAGLSWPFAYAMKLGQVGPLLFLLFAIGWRGMEDARFLGGSAGLGAVVKLQPGLVLVWAALTRRWAAVAIGAAVLVTAGLIATVLAGGFGVWADFFAVIRNVSDPITTPHNFTPGAVAFQLGVPASVAGAVQLLSSVAAVGLVVIAAFRAGPAASYLVTVVASQLLSPVLWDHYAMLLLLPVAFLLERGQWWAILIPLSSSVFFIGLTPAIAYPVAFWVSLIAVTLIGLRPADGGTSRANAGIQART